MLEPYYKKILGYPPNVDDKEILKDWKSNVAITCKPCWELKYCPYGPLVEYFPAYPVTRSEMEGCLDEGCEDILDDLPEDMPPIIILECYCTIFGHMCPVFFTREPFTETHIGRRISRHIPRDIMLKVFRRDGNICQECHEHVKDDEIEFDHIIPFSKGGPTEVHNLRLVCRKCNRTKFNKKAAIYTELGEIFKT